MRSANLLCAAVNARDYQEVDRLLDVYRSEVEACWKVATTRDEQIAISTEVIGLLQWARSATLAARSHAQGKLIQLSRRSAYARMSLHKRERLELDA
jgi:hypothetical protein